MSSNRDIVTGAFNSWKDGTGCVASIFADDMTWEITGRSAVSRTFASTEQFMDEVLHPFAARFSPADPFRPVRIRAIYADEANSTVIVIWDGRGTTTAGTAYEKPGPDAHAELDDLELAVVRGHPGPGPVQEPAVLADFRPSWRTSGRAAGLCTADRSTKRPRGGRVMTGNGSCAHSR
jgi:uncharacterized protein